ncbi:hypothetical protein RR47_GL000702 [Enterococcus columbae DSM 7374 = ATCC 51263]|nr:hypothetical protein RR47_GL000702 [Enterococcus columbae DSM 7374 = ATCC 51263]
MMGSYFVSGMMFLNYLFGLVPVILQAVICVLLYKIYKKMK